MLKSEEVAKCARKLLALKPWKPLNTIATEEELSPLLRSVLDLLLDQLKEESQLVLGLFYQMCVLDIQGIPTTLLNSLLRHFGR